MKPRLVGLGVASLVLVVGVVLAQEDLLRNVARQWVEAFAERGVTQAQIEDFLGHSMAEFTRADAERLQAVLGEIRDGKDPTELLGVGGGTVADDEPGYREPLPLSPAAAQELATELTESEDDLAKVLKDIEESVGKLPDHFPPDLEGEALVVDKFLQLVRTMRKWATDFDRRGPEMLDVAHRYKNKLRETIDALAEGAETDRAEGGDAFTDLAAAEDVVGQTYAQRLTWADQIYRDLRKQIAVAKTSLKLLDRWEAVLVLMKPVAEEGKITQKNRQQILAYLQTLDRAMRSFRAFAEKMRATTESGESAPPKPKPSQPAA